MHQFHNTKGFIIKHKALIILSFFLSALLLVLPACNDNSGDLVNTQTGSDNVSVGFFAENQGDANTIAITEAKFLLKKMVLKFDENENESDVKLGPFIVQLDLTGKVILAAINKIPTGNYDAIKFHVHKPGGNETISDPDFYESNNKRYSVVVKGFYNGVPFVYKSDVNVAKKIDLEGQPLLISEPVVTNITIRMNPYEWFIKNGVVLDPNNNSNNGEIEHNIKMSLRRAFRDMNLDGFPD